MKEMFDFLEKVINKDDVIVVAASGGPDSMFLLHVLNSLKESLRLKLICAHVNHNVRKESEKEAKFVKEYCESNDIIFEYLLIEKYTNNKFSEEEARNKRYAFFDSLMNKYKANILMTAHHGDDLIETILMRIVRGSNLKGYIGIPKIHDNGEYKLIRPLLYLTKDEILNYNKKNRINYVIDKSNYNTKYTRNRYRKQLLPLLKKEDNNVHLKFLKYSEEIERSNSYINIIIENKFRIIVNNNIIDLNKLSNEDEFIQRRIIEKVIENLQKEYLFDIDKEQLNNIVILSKKKKNAEIDLSNNFIARCSYGKLHIEKKEDKHDYYYIFNKKISILDKYSITEVNEECDNSNNIIRLNSNEISMPIIVRPKKDGDRIKVKNLNGTKKVKDIFIDSKIDIKKRREYPIVLDSNNNVLWIPGIKKSIFDKKNNEKYDIILKYVEEKNE